MDSGPKHPSPGLPPPTLPRRSVLGLLGGLGAAGLLDRPARAQHWLARPGLSWTLFYGEDLDPEEFEEFDIAVLDPGFKRPVASVTALGTQALGYLSLGEIKRTSPFFPRLNDPDTLLSENPNWPDTVLCDVRRPAWRALVLDVAIPALLEQGFSGLFFDTLDTPPHLEQTDPERFAGMREAAIDLVRTIRQRFPGRTLLMNRGYALLPELTDAVDGVVAESLLTTYDGRANGYRWIEETERDQHRQALQPLRDASPPVPILSLDYWDPEDADTIREIYARERALGHRPYVAQVLLDKIIREPVATAQR
ncbi:endo alpha-1,4 polygalactosaminidase [Methylobacterium sp. J-068]|uniref:endo alpha-1,4 polygalactosaminidase n=1 Tax=Methylobacterium sp. J-068 TaxID=2836649 RepID=UPI001FB894CC|nr:endo alpha-1,4 polygalactosaminidase [Methylobacterium sp. J-068]MCJ2035351.1 endo alpha-1,4 polygalactosaminidase [Methylobacterium sp. J-068]